MLWYPQHKHGLSLWPPGFSCEKVKAFFFFFSWERNCLSLWEWKREGFSTILHDNIFYFIMSPKVGVVGPGLVQVQAYALMLSGFQALCYTHTNHQFEKGPLWSLPTGAWPLPQSYLWRSPRPVYLWTLDNRKGSWRLFSLSIILSYLEVQEGQEIHRSSQQSNWDPDPLWFVAGTQPAFVNWCKKLRQTHTAVFPTHLSSSTPFPKFLVFVWSLVSFKLIYTEWPETPHSNLTRL